MYVCVHARNACDKLADTAPSPIHRCTKKTRRCVYLGGEELSFVGDLAKLARSGMSSHSSRNLAHPPRMSPYATRAYGLSHDHLIRASEREREKEEVILSILGQEGNCMLLPSTRFVVRLCITMRESDAARSGSFCMPSKLYSFLNQAHADQLFFSCRSYSSPLPPPSHDELD